MQLDAWTQVWAVQVAVPGLRGYRNGTDTSPMTTLDFNVTA